MKVDYYHPPHDVRRVRDAAVRADRMGFDGFFTAETAHDPFMPLAVAADAAPRLELGTAIAVAFPRSPMMVAQTAWDLADLSGGHFVLGLGTQVRAHITRRFSVEWTSASSRLEDYINALRAIWHSFQTGAPLQYRGPHYEFSLLTPFFDPGPIEHPDVPVAIAGVNEHLIQMAGRSADGFHIHPFHTVRYLDEVVIPNLQIGVDEANRTLDDVALISTVFVATGRSEEAIASSIEQVRRQIGFYASTPSYRVILETHGWDVGPELSRLSRRGEWDAIADVVTDEMVEEAAVIGPPEEIGRRIRERFDGRVDRVGYYFIGEEDPFEDEETWMGIIEATR